MAHIEGQHCGSDDVELEDAEDPCAYLTRVYQPDALAMYQKLKDVCDRLEHLDTLRGSDAVDARGTRKSAARKSEKYETIGVLMPDSRFAWGAPRNPYAGLCAREIRNEKFPMSEREIRYEKFGYAKIPRHAVFMPGCAPR